ncbi:MAG TPA: type 4a pilus biogenesis protein PilO [Thermoanaerobaculia bacterium]|nr:type 4a pilus biogenesis protein PilO [Thermoanaerobaculia bacterium]
MALELGMEGKPWYYGLLIGLALAALIVFGVHYFLIKPLNAEIVIVDAELDELAKKIQAGRSAEKKLPQFREEVKRLELELDKLRRILPSSRNTEEIIKKIKALVDQGDFTLRRIAFPPLVPSEESEVYSEWPISIAVEGGYHNLAILFNRLSSFSRIMNVEQFSINALGVQSERTVTSEFVAKTFVYIEPKNEPDTADGTPGGAQ